MFLFRSLLLLLLLASGLAAAPAASSAKQGNPLTRFTSLLSSNRHHLYAAASARATSIAAMYPVDTVKTRMQLGKGLKLSGLFAGLGSSLAGQVPYGVLTFGSYEIYTQALADRLPNLPILPRAMIAAVMGDLTGSFWLCPSEVLKQNIQSGTYANVGSGVRGIVSSSGLGGFYRGYWGGVARDVPFRVGQMCSYEFVKSRYLRRKSGLSAGRRTGAARPELSNAEAACLGAFAGSFSALATTPLDKVKTCMMTAQYEGTFWAVAEKILKKEGPGAFMQGAVPRVGLIGPSVAIFFVVYERTKRLVLEW